MNRKTASILGALLVAAALTACTAKPDQAAQTDDTQTKNPEDVIVLPIEEEEESEFEYEFTPDGAILTAYNGTAEDVVLTEKVTRVHTKKGETTTEEYTLTEIGAGAFMNDTTIRTVVIPDSVLRIGTAAFQGCSSLTAVTLPAGLEKIADQTFYGCDALETLAIPETVKTIGIFAFGDYFDQIPWYKAQTAVDVIVGDGVLLRHNGASSVVRYGSEVKKVAYYAFLDSPATQVYFSSATEDISEIAFYRSSAAIMLPEGSELIGKLKLKNIPVSTYVE